MAFVPSGGLAPSTRSTSQLREGSELVEAGGDLELFPTNLPFQRIQGGETLRTYKMPPGSERVQMTFKTNGRPLKARAEIWLGPTRRVHYCEMDLHDGMVTPYSATLKFKSGVEPVLRIATTSSHEFPMEAGVAVPSDDRNTELNDLFNRVWDNAEHTAVQGGQVVGGHGAVRVFPIPADVDSVQVLFWSKDVGKKSFKSLIEILQGPNNKKQVYDLQCGGSTQPYHGVFQTPGEGWQIRMYNKKYVEDGLVETSVVPYKRNGKLCTAIESLKPLEQSMTGTAGTMGGSVTPGPDNSRPWWQ
jgi:hypothetical protein